MKRPRLDKLRKIIRIIGVLDISLFLVILACFLILSFCKDYHFLTNSALVVTILFIIIYSCIPKTAWEKCMRKKYGWCRFKIK